MTMESAPSKNSQTSINYRSKDAVEEIPMGAVIKKTETNIDIREIENGWLKTINVYTSYSVMEKEEGEESEMEDKWHSSSKTYFSKEKPIDIQMAYSV